jgi:hypothetical protein
VDTLQQHQRCHPPRHHSFHVTVTPRHRHPPAHNGPSRFTLNERPPPPLTPHPSPLTPNC